MIDPIELGMIEQAVMFFTFFFLIGFLIWRFKQDD